MKKRIWVYFFQAALVVSGLSADRESPKTNSVSVPLSKGVKLSVGNGRLIGFNGKGITIRFDEGGFSPNIAYGELTDSDISILLKNPDFFDALFEFNPVISPDFELVDKGDFERRIENLWASHASLQERVAERMQILEMAKQFNINQQLWRAKAKTAGTAEFNRRVANFQIEDARESIQQKRNLRRLGIYSDARSEMRTENQAKAKFAQAAQISDAEEKAAVNSAHLAITALEFLVEKGFHFSDRPQLIPTLRLDRGIDAEILKDRPAKKTTSESVAAPGIDGLLKFQMERAEKGSESAQYALGIRYLKGDGVPKDESTAKVWLEKSAAQGNADAKTALRRFDK